MSVAYIALGSNLGDRKENLDRALDELKKAGIKVAAVSKYLESEPYIKQGVWEKVQVEKCNAVIVNNEKVGN